MQSNPNRLKNTKEPTCRLNEAIERYLTALEDGQQPDREELLREFPEYAEQLAEQLQGLDFIHRVAPQLVEVQPKASSADAVTALATLGDFRILREVGRGGMGVVYEAEQLSISRSVALKVLPFAALLDPRQLQRFKTEARAAGGLHHAHIVPVFSVGCERGVHYYAMQLINGPSLDKIANGLATDVAPRGGHSSENVMSSSHAGRSRINCQSRHNPISTASHPVGLPETHRQIQAAVTTKRSQSRLDYHRLVADWGAQAAGALAYAHDCGVLHRDVKPGNLLLDETGHLWLTDFGLARLEQDASMTFTGDVLGTLRYMSPEQALGQHILVDHRADIYSLGATLYELLSLRPVFDGRDRQQLLSQISTAEPMALRRLDERIPVNLETIVLKTLAKEPAARYSSAQELADDLRRFHNDRPILARPPTLWQRGALWVKRHQALAVGAALLLLIATLSLSVSLAVVSRQRNEVERARRAATQHLTLARSAIDGLVTRVAENDLLNTPRMEHVREEMLQESADFYEQATALETDNPELELAQALAYQRLGQIHLALNQRDRALHDHELAVNALRQLHQQRPDYVHYIAALAETLRQRAEVLHRSHFVRGNEMLAQAATDSLTEAVSLLETTIAKSPDRIDLKQQLVECYLVGVDLSLSGIKAFIDTRELTPVLPVSAAVLADAPEDPQRRHLHARLLHRLAAGYDEQKQSRFEWSVAMLEQLVADYPDVAEYRLSLALAIWSQLNSRFRGSSEAVDDRRRVVGLFEQLCRDFPNVTEHRANLANARHHLAMSLAYVDHAATSEEYRKAEQLLLQLIEGNPDFFDYYNRLSFIYGAWCQFLQQDTHDPQLLIEVMQRKLENDRKRPNYQGTGARSRGVLSHALIEVGRFEEGIALCQESLSMLEDDWTSFERIGRWAAEKLSRAGRHADAAAFCDRLVAKRRQIIGQRSSETAAQDVTLGRTQTFASRVYLAGGRIDKASELARAGVANQDDPDSEQYSAAELTAWCNLLGEEFYAVDSPEHAKAMFELEFEVWDRASSRDSAPEGCVAHLMWAKMTSPFPEHWCAQHAVGLAKSSELSADHATRRVASRVIALAQYRLGRYRESIATIRNWMNSTTGALWARGGEWFLLAMNHWQLGEHEEAGLWHERAVEWMNAENTVERKIKNVVFSLGVGDRFAPRNGMYFDNRVPRPVNGDGERHTMGFVLERLQQESEDLNAPGPAR